MINSGRDSKCSDVAGMCVRTRQGSGTVEEAV
jgi:hypothetical protein